MNDLDNIGVVIKIDEDEAIVMTDDAVFKRIKKRPGIYKGQKILINDNDIILENKKYFYPVFAGIASVLLVFLVSYYLFLNSSKPYSYISIDINPSIELEVSENENIKDITALNPDGKMLMENIEVKGLNISRAISLIIEKSKDMGYIDKNSKKYSILIAAALGKDNGEDGTEREKKFDDFLDRVKKDLNKKYSLADAKVIKVPQGLREKAKSINLSMGKYFIYSEAKRNGKAISIEELGAMDLGALLKGSYSGNANTSKIYEEATPVQRQSPAPLSIKPTPKERSAALPVLPTTSLLPTPMIVTTLSPTPLKPQTNTALSTPQQTETIMGNGLIGEYYNNSDFTEYIMSRVDTEINFRWAENSPDALIGKDTFSVRWTGFVVPRFSEKYTFMTYADDGVRLWINNVLIIDNWKSQSPVYTEGSMELVAGKQYEIRLEYFENVKSCQVKLSWTSNSQKKEIIPSSQLFHKASVYEGENAMTSRCIIESVNTGFSGNGYVNFINETGGYIDWVVNIKKDGLYTLNFWYANGTDVDRPLEIKVNHNLVCEGLSFGSTGSWTTWKRQYAAINLKAGINIIRTTAVSKDGGPNIDKMEVI
jgi:hypothetical protein